MVWKAWVLFCASKYGIVSLELATGCCLLWRQPVFFANYKKIDIPSIYISKEGM